MLEALAAQWKPAVLGVVTGLVLLSIGGAYLKGRSDGRAITEGEIRADLVQQLTDRGKTDEDVSRMSADELCRDLGGVFRGGRCE
nr:hypothetical protein [Rhizobium sp. ACO-34A]